MKDNSNSFILTILLVPACLLIIIALTSCKALHQFYHRDGEIHQRISRLELGMSKQSALEVIGYQPDFMNKEAMPDGLRETLIYRGSYRPNGWMGAKTPTVYSVLFENNRLVAIYSDKDYEQIRIDERRRYERELKEAEERRTTAILEAQKAKEKEKDNKSK